jgi:hypothetical protein
VRSRKQQSARKDYSGDGRFAVAMTLAFMKSLPLDDQLELWSRAGFTYGEIGEFTGLTENAVKLRFFSWRKRKSNRKA